MARSPMSHPVTKLSLSIHGQEITDQQLHTVLERFYPNPFTRDDFEREFQSVCSNMPHDKDAIRRVMQHLKRRRQIVYHRNKKIWSFTSEAIFDFGNAKTIPLPEIRRLPDSEPARAPGNRFFGFLRKLILYVACLSSVLALMTLNASFAYGLAENRLFQVAFVMGLMASDLMRPLLVAAGLNHLARKHFGKGMLAVLVALSLSPVSVLSTTTVISAALSLGAEANARKLTRSTTRQTLQSEYDRLKKLADKQWNFWKQECKRGGCGKRALSYQQAAQKLETEMKSLLPKIVSLTQSTQGKSSFVSRSVKAFEGLHIYGKDRELILPILLALTLEIAALFGPGLLLEKFKENSQRQAVVLR